ncbi:protein NRT1/ PTR FAMILY 5.10-like [Vitis riparia]|uniref:protein NRT1/ PTR FAMILY 5.10-like n=1 Tax=Vitis riparia TaxID=96939 RepID=UPI00155AD75A|nr:protein NRT1/ PTR FAMILY 5.10-like [Vitis riparia]
MANMLQSLESPLLEDTVNGTVDHQGYPSKRSSSGGWRSAIFIIGVEVAERFAYCGIGSNLINYLTGPLGQSTAMAAANVNTWAGTATLLPLLGAFVADSYLGRYRTIVLASLLYILGLSLLTLSAMLPSLITFQSQNVDYFTSYSPPQLQIVLFFFSLYLVAVGQGGHKPCTQAFGADQFDGQNLEECKAKSSFFNWWLFGVSTGTSVTSVVVSYIEENFNWGLGFGIPCIVMVAALLVFLLGTRTYRFTIKRNGKSPFVRIGKVFVEAARNWRTTPSLKAIQERTQENLPHHGSHKFKFLNKALLVPACLKGDGKACSITDVEEAKAVLSLFPIWATSLVYGIVTAQSSTFFTKQGITMDRSIGSGFRIPAASLLSFIPITIILFIPIYDCIFVRIARALTGKPSGITMLQRSGIGFLLCVVSMVTAAIVEMKRLKTAKEYGLVDMPNVTVPMRVWWLIPQYILLGIADVFAMVGLQEFFYDQIPNELRSVGLSLYLSIYGVGSFLSGFLISIIEETTGGDGKTSWFNNNLNRAHIDHFYWLLAGLSAVELAAFLYFAKSYVYNVRTS